MVDTLDLKSSEETHSGSSPESPTKIRARESGKRLKLAIDQLIIARGQIIKLRYNPFYLDPIARMYINGAKRILRERLAQGIERNND